jgi:virginiamycin B lyase
VPAHCGSAPVGAASFVSIPRRSRSRPGSRRPGGSIGVGSTSFDAGALWVTQLPKGGGFDNGYVLRIDPATNRVTARTPVGFEPGDTCVTGGSVWVLNGIDGTVSQIVPSTAIVRRTIEVGGSEDFALACRFGSVWATQFDESAVVRVAA